MNHVALGFLLRTVSITILGVAVAILCGCDRRDAQVPSPATTRNSVWPDLSKFPSLRNHVATQDEVNAGRAVFILQGRNGPIGKPIDMELPQYAYHIDKAKGTKTPGIIIQAEEAKGQKLIGFVALPDETHMVAMLEEFELLGIRRPN
jgi:hypothetical protein